MKKRLLFCSLISALTACQHEGDVQPNSATLAAEVVGTYRTNFYLDPSCVAIPADQMPFAELQAESDSTVSFIYTRLYPTKTQRTIQHVHVSRQTDGVRLRLADSSIGMLQTDRIFTNNGMEKEGKLLRVNLQNDSKNPLYFAGFR
ncbi:hypothetical protein [Spirosoma areae]